MSSPFNEAKYKALLEGIEISIIQLSKVDHVKNRLDAEYYKKFFLLVENQIKQIGQTNLGEIGAKLDCSAFYPSITDYYNFDGAGIPFLRVNEISNGLVKITDSTAFLPQTILDNNTSTIAIGYPGDLIIAKGGNTLAKVGLITNQYDKYALSRDIILVRTNNIQKYNRYFLWLFMHSNIGQALLWRTASQTGQPHLTLPSISEIPLPQYSGKFEELAEELYKKSVLLNNKSIEYYQQSENILLETLGLKDFQTSTDSINVKGFNESFLSTGRLDAEYYQKKYEDYLKLIQSYSNGFALLTSVCNLKDNNYNPEDNKEYKYVELADIGKTGDITGCTNAKGIELPTRARRMINTDDVVISSIEGSLESCALVSEEYNNVLCSTGLYVINSKQINSETLLVLFKSEPMQYILKQNCSGTILTAINKSEFQNIPVPLINSGVQKQIKDKISESFRLKKESEQLLETAKRAVEIAIEENEEKAMKFINELK